MTVDDLVVLTDGFAEHLVPIPEDADDVCPHCHSSRNESVWQECWSCGQVQQKIGRPCPVVVPISFYTRPLADEPLSPFREVMHNFKEDPDPNVRAGASLIVGGIIVRYLLTHRDALADKFGQWDIIVPVPSTTHDGRPALAVAMDSYSDLCPSPVDVMTRGRGQIARSEPATDAFITQDDLRGKRVMLVDDTFTTGAHLQSAAATLVGAGADVRFAVVIARKIQPSSRYPASVNVWKRQSAIDFDFAATQFWAQ